VSHHPERDEKLFADSLMGCGGGPAANAAVTISRLGFRSAFAGYLGQDIHGHAHHQEFLCEGVDTRFLVRGEAPTPVSVVLVKPDGSRSLVCYKGETQSLAESDVDFSGLQATVLLFDGHEPALSHGLLGQSAPKVLDAGSLHAGTESLMFHVDYLVGSEKFARQWLGEDDPERAVRLLSERSPAVVITLGERGLIWRKAGESGRLPAYSVSSVDSTGAGDAFHGAFAAALSAGMAWQEILRFASAAGAACCKVLGARPGLPNAADIARLMNG
jgi:sulfofructose kinase